MKPDRAPVPRRHLGQTGLQASVLGLGTVKFGRNHGVKYPQGFELPSDRAIVELLAHARELGVNLLDTAPAYGSSERRLGQLIGHRQDWLIVTKAGECFADGTSTYDFSPPAITRSVHESMRRLATDYLDVVLLHSDGRDIEILNSGALDALVALRDAGTVRAVGISHKSPEGLNAAIEARCDVVMATLNPGYRSELDGIARAGEKGVGVLVKKALASGRGDPADLAWTAGRPGVSSIIVGTLNPDHLRADATVLTSA